MSRPTRESEEQDEEGPHPSKSPAYPEMTVKRMNLTADFDTAEHRLKQIEETPGVESLQTYQM